MVISVSRRTDIPACHPDWFMNRIRAGYVNVVDNPRFPGRVLRRSLLPEDVTCFVFWTKNPGPLKPYLDELDERGFRYFWQYTVTGYPRVLEPNVPSVEQSMETLLALSEQCGPRSIIWRYDPVLFSTATPITFHMEMYHRLAEAFGGHVGRCFVSLLDTARPQVRGALAKLERTHGVHVFPIERSSAAVRVLMPHIVSCAGKNGIELRSCREVLDLSQFGIPEGVCVDQQYIESLFGIELPRDTHSKRDPNCRCYWGPDVGMYSTCRNGCVYCYANESESRLTANLKSHCVDSPSLCGWLEPDESKVAGPCHNCGQCNHFSRENGRACSLSAEEAPRPADVTSMGKSSDTKS